MSSVKNNSIYHNEDNINYQKIENIDVEMNSGFKSNNGNV